MNIDEWKSIHTGQTIYNKYGRPRTVLRGCNNSLCIVLNPLRKTDTNATGSVYDRQCMSLFFLSPPGKIKMNEINHDNVKVSDEDSDISLSKLIGKQIKDVHGSLRTDFGQVTMKLTKLIFDDNSFMFFEGEHDFPYLTNGDIDQPNFNDENLDRLYNEQ